MSAGSTAQAAHRGTPTAAARPALDATFVDAVRERLRITGGARTSPPPAEVLARTVEAVAHATGAVLGSQALWDATAAVRDALFGAGALQVLLDDPEVTDVLVNGPRDVWVERAGVLGPVDVDLGDEAAVRALAVRLAAAGGRRLDDAAPTVDARLPDGTRLHAVLPPVAEQGTLLSLRTVRTRALALDDLVASGTLAPGLLPVVRSLVHGRANLLVSGATGSGKTTLLAALLSAVGDDERIVVIEEAAELRPRHPHVVRLVARRPNVDGAGGVDLPELVRQALRMRPDRIVLGECRGAEVRDVMAALNTGHDGGCATVHANAARDVPARLEALGALAGLTREAVAAQAISAFDAVLHLRRAGPQGHRYVAEVGAVLRVGAGWEVVAAATADSGGATVRGPAWPVLEQRLAERQGESG